MTPSKLEEFIERIKAEREAAGLPTKVTDAATLDRIAALLVSDMSELKQAG